MATVPERKKRLILNVLFDELSGPSDLFTDDPMEEVIMHLASKRARPAELMGTARISNYVEETVPTYSDPLFKAHFRMSRTSFQLLMELIGPLTIARVISLERRTLACIWYLSNQETFRSVADRFGLSKGSLHYYLGNFCRLMSGESVLPKYIQWPDQHDYAKIADGFAQRAGFPGVIGAVDGTYIPIPGPSEFRDSYICRKGYPAFHLQGVCDSNLKFIDVFSAYPGSVHDSRVFKNSPLCEHLQREHANGGQAKGFHLLGDSAYGLSPYLMVPFRDNGHLKPEEKKYNLAHSSTRVDIERSFGLLKGKFRKLKFLDVTNTSVIPNIIVTCCVIHNFILTNDLSEEDANVVDMESDPSIDSLGTRTPEASSVGIHKRREIMHLLA